MSDAWFNFGLIVLIQFFVFTVYACYSKKLSDVPRILLWSIPTGILVGILFDLIVGKFFGFHSYTLGFTTPFLILNGALMYGFFVANILLARHVSFTRFCVFMAILSASYEIPNQLFRVWTWKFEVAPPFEFLIVLICGYVCGGILMALIWHLLGHRFFFITNLLK